MLYESEEDHGRIAVQSQYSSIQVGAEEKAHFAYMGEVSDGHEAGHGKRADGAFGKS